MQRIAAIFIIIAGGWAGSASAQSVYTYTADFNLPIPKPDLNDPNITQGWMDDAIIEIPHHLVIVDLDIGITLTHTNVFDLQIFLKSPAGQVICLNKYDFDEFFIGADYIETVFDDEAFLSIKQGSPPFTGRFKPVEPYELSDFDGIDAYGLWHLRIYDAWPWDIGTLNHVELIITIPEPATAVLLILGVALLKLFNPRRR